MSDKFTHADRVFAVSICTPAVRMVVVEVWVCDEDGCSETHHYFNPVAAIQSTVRKRYSRSYRGDCAPIAYGTEKELIEDGWWLDEQELHNTALVMDEGELCPYDAPVFGRSSNEERLLVCTPWPPEEDETRLATVIERLEKEIKTRLSRKKNTKVTTP